jgi:hypothetical protein
VTNRVPAAVFSPLKPPGRLKGDNPGAGEDIGT